MEAKKDTFEPKLVPILREGIQIIKMVLFAQLKPALAADHAALDAGGVGLLAGAVVNRIFGVQNREEPYAAFENDHRDLIDTEVAAVPKRFDHLRIPLTDALRIQFLCDGHEGIDGSSVLEKAAALEILILERDVPMPGAFMSIARSFGMAYKILDPQMVRQTGRTNETHG